MLKNHIASLIACLLLLCASCRPEEEPEPLPIQAGNRVLVVCEGMLGNGNAALSLYRPDSSKVIEDVYQASNKLSLGDVFQSMTRIEGRYFLCINNSDRITVVNSGDFRLEGSIALPKPRYIVPVSETKAYVSTLFSDKVYIINPKTLSVTGSITMPFQNPEGMLRVGQSIYVCTWDTAAGAVYPIDIATDVVGAGIPVVGRAPQEILQDAEGMIWVLSGNSAKGKESVLSRIHPATGALLKSYSFGPADPVRPVMNRTRDTIYFIEVNYSGQAAHNGIYRMGIREGALPAQPFIPAQGFQYFWGLGIHPSSGHIYIADPVGFTQRGKAYVYTADGARLASFATGVGPGHFYFE